MPSPDPAIMLGNVLRASGIDCQSIPPEACHWHSANYWQFMRKHHPRNHNRYLSFEMFRRALGFSASPEAIKAVHHRIPLQLERLFAHLAEPGDYQSFCQKQGLPPGEMTARLYDVLASISVQFAGCGKPHHAGEAILRLRIRHLAHLVSNTDDELQALSDIAQIAVRAQASQYGLTFAGE